MIWIPIVLLTAAVVGLVVKVNQLSGELKNNKADIQDLLLDKIQKTSMAAQLEEWDDLYSKADKNERRRMIRLKNKVGTIEAIKIIQNEHLAFKAKMYANVSPLLQHGAGMANRQTEGITSSLSAE